MPVIVKGGTVVNSDQSFQADVYCEDGIIQAVGPDMDAPSGVEVIDAGGCIEKGSGKLVEGVLATCPLVANV